MNIQSIIAASVANESLMPVSTALYQLNIGYEVLNSHAIRPWAQASLQRS